MHSWPAGAVGLSAHSPLPKGSGRACCLPRQHPLSGVRSVAPWGPPSVPGGVAGGVLAPTATRGEGTPRSPQPHLGSRTLRYVRCIRSSI